MKIHRSIMAHPRMCPAHWPEPLTAPGAAQACPTCLPSPSHQLTGIGDLRLGCPLQKSARFAPRYSAIGNITGNRPADIPLRTPSMNVLMSGLCSGRQGLRSLAPPFLTEAAHQHNFPDSLGFARPIVPSSPLRPDTRLRPERFGAVTCRRPAFSRLPMPVPAVHPLICGVRAVWPRPRPLTLAALANPANQLTWDGDLRHDRPLMKGVRFAPGHSSIGGFTSQQALALVSSPTRDQLWSVPSLLEKAHLRVSALPADGLPNRSGKSHTARTFHPYQPTAQTSECLPAYLAPGWSYGFHVNTRPDQDRLPTTRNGHNFDTARGQSHSLLADSKTSAYSIETLLLRFAFNPTNTSWHLGRPHLINPIRRSHVRQDSDFRWKSRGRKKPGFSSFPSGVRRPSERLAPAHQTSSVEINT